MACAGRPNTGLRVDHVGPHVGQEIGEERQGARFGCSRIGNGAGDLVVLESDAEYTGGFGHHAFELLPVERRDVDVLMSFE